MVYNLLCLITKDMESSHTSLRQSTHSAAAFNRSTALHFRSLPWARWFQRRENSHDVMRSVSLSAMERIYPLGICEAKYNVSVISPETLDMIRLRTMRPNISMD